MLSLEMGHDDFSASNGWLQAWQKRHNVKWAALCGEAAEVPQDVVADWTMRLPELTAGYALADIYNADETGLYYGALHERSMVVRGDPRKGIKTSKERVTVLLTCSATGEKLKPLLIGKSLKPRCFKGIDKAALPVTYCANRKAWMTSVLFKEWLDKLNSKMKMQGRNILLFVDNCGAHPEVKLTNVKMVFLPPNTTSRLQPCDAGIIAALKAHYRKRLMRHVLAGMDDARTATELSKSVNMLDAIGWLHLAWASVSESTVMKCFAKCGFSSDTRDDVPEDVLQPVGFAYDELLGVVSWADYISMDDGTSTTDVASDEWEAALIAKARGEVPADDSSSDEDAEEPAEPTPVLTIREALVRVNELVTFAISNTQEMIFMLNVLLPITCLLLSMVKKLPRSVSTNT